MILCECFRDGELKDQIEHLQEQIRQVENDLDEVQGEKAEKLKELKTKEKERTEFISSFEEQKKVELERIHDLEEAIVIILEHISETVQQSENLPSVSEYEDLQEDLVFKQEEYQKATTTAQSLDIQNVQLQKNLENIEAMEAKITDELKTLKENISNMESEISVYSNLEQLKNDEEHIKRELLDEKEKLTRRKETAANSNDIHSLVDYNPQALWSGSSYKCNHLMTVYLYRPY
jgi:intraflagellar transport protein 74